MITAEMARASSAKIAVAAGANENAAPGLRDTASMRIEPMIWIGSCPL